MTIKLLNINSFRNLQTVQITPSEKINYIIGKNGSGKTSVLEAIYVLGRGRSFIHNDIKYLARYNSSGFALKAYMKNSNDEEYCAEFKRLIEQKVVQKTINSLPASRVELAKTLPIQLFNYKDYFILSGAPAQRRQLLDWGLFHVEQSFHKVWAEYQRILKQRNAALKMGYVQQQIQVFDIGLIKSGLLMHSLRKKATSLIGRYLLDFSNEFFGINDLSIVYKPGWCEEDDYADMLKKRFNYDIMLGYTQQGPHCSDLDVLSGNKKIQYSFSLGQQKVVSVLLKLAVSKYVYDKTNTKIVYLIDDLLAELDDDNKQKIMKAILSLKGQIFLSSVEKNEIMLQDKRASVFHVEHGCVKGVTKHETTRG